MTKPGRLEAQSTASVGVFENNNANNNNNNKGSTFKTPICGVFLAQIHAAERISRQPDLALGLAERIRKPCPLEAQLVSRCSAD